MKKYTRAKDFENCEICGQIVSKLEYDSPLYCEKCISEMEKMDLNPKKYKKYIELKESLPSKT